MSAPELTASVVPAPAAEAAPSELTSRHLPRQPNRRERLRPN